MVWTLPKPLLSGYSLKPTDPVVRTEMEVGAHRSRRRSFARNDLVTAVWRFSDADYQAFRVWHETAAGGGSAWVSIPLAVGDGGITTREAKFAKIYEAQLSPGLYWTVSAELEIRSVPLSAFEQMNILGLPSLELDFAGTRSISPVIRNPIQSVPEVSFTNSSANRTYFDNTGTLRYAGVNEPRFDHDPVTGVCKGLLIEESRTNLLTYSEKFDNAVWSKSLTVSPSVAVSPDGTLTKTRISESTATQQHYVLRAVATPISTPLSLSVYAELASGDRYFSVCIANQAAVSNTVHAIFDLSNGTIIKTASTGNGVGATATIIAIGSGKYRCTVSGTPDTSGGDARVILNLSNSAISYIPVYTGDGTSSVYIWGAQLEAGAFPTSYIPTTSAQATRAADVAKMIGENFSSWYRQDEGTFMVDVTYSTVAEYSTALSADAGTAADSIRIIGWNDGTDRTSVYTSNVAQFAGGRSGNTAARHNYALAYKLNDFASAKDGNLLTDISGTLPTPTGLRIGSTGGSSFFLNGHIARLAFYPKRLSNAELQALSL